MRKIVQIATTSTGNPIFGGIVRVVYALCDDGTLWAKTPSEPGDDWDQVDISNITGGEAKR